MASFNANGDPLAYIDEARINNKRVIIYGNRDDEEDRILTERLGGSSYRPYGSVTGWDVHPSGYEYGPPPPTMLSGVLDTANFFGPLSGTFAVSGVAFFSEKDIKALQLAADPNNYIPPSDPVDALL